MRNGGESSEKKPRFSPNELADAIEFAPNEDFESLRAILGSFGNDGKARAKWLSENLALHMAVESSNEPAMRMLLEAGADPDRRSGDEESALMRAARMGRKDEVAALLEWGADVNLAQEDGWTALMLGAWSGNEEVVRMAIRAGSDLDARNKDGETALLIAASLHAGAAAEVGRMLLEAGADDRIRREDGCSPEEMARGRENQELAEELRGRRIAREERERLEAAARSSSRGIRRGA